MRSPCQGGEAGGSSLPQEAWKPLERLPRFMKLPRLRDASPSELKRALLISRAMGTKVSVVKDISGIEYQPLKCSRPYRLIIVRKNVICKRASRYTSIKSITFCIHQPRFSYKGEQIVPLANKPTFVESVVEQLQKV